MGYGDGSSQELEATINAAECDVVVAGTPIDLGRLITSRHPIRHVRYELEEVGDADAGRRARADRRPGEDAQIQRPSRGVIEMRTRTSRAPRPRSRNLPGSRT